MTVEIADLRLIPFYDGDVEAAGDPPPVGAFKDQIRSADAVLIATPEYNGTVPGVLQNAIDWASRPRGSAPLLDKPVAIMGASPGQRGTARAQTILRQVLTNAGARVLPTPELLVPRAAEGFDAAGLLTDGEVRDGLIALLTALAAWAENGSKDDSAAA